MRTSPPQCHQKRDPISSFFYWHCNRKSLLYRHLIHHSLREPVALVSGALGPLRGRGPVCLSVVLEPVREQDIALPLYMKRIHHLSLHRMNYVQSVLGKQSWVRLEGNRENLQRFCVGLKIQVFWVKESLCGLFLKLLIIILNIASSTFTIITDACCAAKLC